MGTTGKSRGLDALQLVIAQFGIDIDRADISFNTGPATFRSWMDKEKQWAPNVSPEVAVTFHFDRETPHNMRAVKRACGGRMREAYQGGSPPLVGEWTAPDNRPPGDDTLPSSTNPEPVKVKFTIQGAYKCETVCVPTHKFEAFRTKATERDE